MSEEGRLMHTYSSENGWGTLASSLDDAHKNLFDQLKTLDFTQTEPEMLLCRAGIVHLYVRYIPPGKKMLPLAFDFCCILTICGLLYIVGLKTLQDVFAFLKEIDAHPVVPQPMTLADAERKAMQGYIATIMDQMEQRVATLLNMAAWRKTVERLAQTLEAMGQHAVAGQSRSVSMPPLPGVPASQQNADIALPETHGGPLPAPPQQE
jgi:hypothetical protein